MGGNARLPILGLLLQDHILFHAIADTHHAIHPGHIVLFGRFGIPIQGFLNVMALRFFR